MNGAETIRLAFAGAHNWYNGTVADVSAEQANHLPPGVCQPIGALMAHILHSEDVLINMFVKGGQPPLWASEGWGERIGGEMLLDQNLDQVRGYNCDPGKLAGYAEAVFANTDAALAALSDADLDREANLMEVGFPMNMTLGAFLSQMLVGNTFAHTGEISALKGTLSMKGYPF